MNPPALDIADTQEDAAARAADWIARKLAASDGPFRMALSGGSTPRALYARLASREIAWSRLEFFWGDERFVPHGDPRSNYAMARETLLDRVPVGPAQIHPIPTDGDPADAANRYEARLKQAYGSDRIGATPLFDLVLLGLGEDGHTASLFPGDAALEEREHWVAPAATQSPEPRITLTYPALESSRAVVFFVTGAEKAGAVKGVLAGDGELPAARLKPRGQTVWFLDRAAAQRLPRPSSG
jgi:6-phosphogluconolactonase